MTTNESYTDDLSILFKLDHLHNIAMKQITSINNKATSFGNSSQEDLELISENIKLKSDEILAQFNAMNERAVQDAMNMDTEEDPASMKELEEIYVRMRSEVKTRIQRTRTIEQALSTIKHVLSQKQVLALDAKEI